MKCKIVTSQKSVYVYILQGAGYLNWQRCVDML